MTDPILDTGDHVYHKPSRETWLVAYVSGDLLAWCGWPAGCASLSDCRLIYKATPSERMELLRSMADMHDDDHRRRHARWVLGTEAA